MVSTSKYQDRAEELKAFDKTKAGVKGLVDSGITYVPDMFIHPSSLTTTHEYPKAVAPAPAGPILPVIDLAGCRGTMLPYADAWWGRCAKPPRGTASSTWWATGSPAMCWRRCCVRLVGSLSRIWKVKKKHFSRDYFGRSCAYNSNFDLYV